MAPHRETPDLQNKLSRGISGESSESAEFDCVLQQELYYDGADMHILGESYSSMFRGFWPFTDSETVKDCMLAVMDEVLNGDKMKMSETSAIKNVPVRHGSGLTFL